MERFRDFTVSEIEGLYSWSKALEERRQKKGINNNVIEAIWKPENLALNNPGLLWALVRHAQSILFHGAGPAGGSTSILYGKKSSSSDSSSNNSYVYDKDHDGNKLAPELIDRTKMMLRHMGYHLFSRYSCSFLKI